MQRHSIIIDVFDMSFIHEKILDPVYCDRGPGLPKSWTRCTLIVDPAYQDPGPGLLKSWTRLTTFRAPRRLALSNIVDRGKTNTSGHISAPVATF